MEPPPWRRVCLGFTHGVLMAAQRPGCWLHGGRAGSEAEPSACRGAWVRRDGGEFERVYQGPLQLVEVGGLRSGCSYRFRVQAFNAVRPAPFDCHDALRDTRKIHQRPRGTCRDNITGRASMCSLVWCLQTAEVAKIGVPPGRAQHAQPGVGGEDGIHDGARPRGAKFGGRQPDVCDAVLGGARGRRRQPYLRV